MKGTFQRADIHRDDKATILQQFKAYQELKLEPNPALLKALTQNP